MLTLFQKFAYLEFLSHTLADPSLLKKYTTRMMDRLQDKEEAAAAYSFAEIVDAVIDPNPDSAKKDSTTYKKSVDAILTALHTVESREEVKQLLLPLQKEVKAIDLAHRAAKEKYQSEMILLSPAPSPPPPAVACSFAAAMENQQAKSNHLAGQAPQVSC